jgi:hypothetical protein
MRTAQPGAECHIPRLHVEKCAWQQPWKRLAYVQVVVLAIHDLGLDPRELSLSHH